MPATLRALVLGPRQTLAWGISLGTSLRLAERLRLGTNLGYLTAHDRSTLGNARLHAVSVEANFATTLLHPSANSALDVGAGAGLYRAVVVMDSAWGVDESNVNAWFALWQLYAELSAAVNDDVRVLTQLRAVKDLVGLRLNAGGQEAMSFHGFGAELRIGATYAW
jgi:hypothetical protein